MRWSLLCILLLVSPVAGQVALDRQAVHNVFTVDVLFDEWESTYPDFVERNTIGQSEGGQPLHEVIITDESVPFEDPPHSADRKYRVYLDGGHHGNEFLGVEIMLYYLEELLDQAAQGEEEALALLGSTEIRAVPILNVEGNLRDTRVNLNGVDPNRNYDFGHTPCSIPGLTCGGPEPFSESEIAANAGHVAALLPDLWLSMHTGIEVLFYPAGEPFVPTAADQALFDAMEGPFERAAGGRIDMTGGPAPAVGSAEDWGYAVLGVNSFVYEVHDDQNLPVYGEPISDLLQDQIDGLAFLIEGAPRWGALVEVHPHEDGIEVVNHGWGEAHNVTIRAGTQTATLVSLGPGNGTVLPGPWHGEATWTYPVLLVESSRMRSHHAMLGEPSPDPETNIPAAGIALLMVGLLFAARRR